MVRSGSRSFTCGPCTWLQHQPADAAGEASGAGPAGGDRHLASATRPISSDRAMTHDVGDAGGRGDATTSGPRPARCRWTCRILAQAQALYAQAQTRRSRPAIWRRTRRESTASEKKGGRRPAGALTRIHRATTKTATAPRPRPRPRERRRRGPTWTSSS